MAPRATTLLSLMSSTSYPPLPSIDDLEQLHQALTAQSSAVSQRLAATTPFDDDNRKGSKKNDKKRDRDTRDRERGDDEERAERAALAANERAGIALEAVERRRFDSSDVKVKRERVSPAPSNASSASFRPNSSQNTYGGMLNKKKKPKRVLDSDDEGTTAHPTPPPHSASTSGLKLKLPPGGHQKSRAPSQADPSPTPSSATATGPQPGSAIDWSVPPQPSRPLVPPRPGIQKPLKPGPKRQADVDEDYSDKKAPSQIAVQTFWQNIEPYIRDIREDDLAMLNFKADTPESYVIPPRGKHYTEIWDEEDGNPPGTTPRFPVPSMRRGSGPTPPLQPFIASDVRDPQLQEENRGLGPMTERIVAAVIGGDDLAQAAKEAAEKNPEPAEDGPAEAAKVDVVDLEDRVKKELRSVMLLGEHEEFDPNNREDDEVTSALRQCQRLLSKQTVLNEARKARLAEIARQRLAFSEYQGVLDDLEKQIEASWAKRVKKHGSGGKKTISNGVISGNGRPPVPDSLKSKVQLRRRWLDTVGATMRERPTGEVLGLPTKSIFEGIGDESDVEKVADDDEEEVESTAV